MKIKSGNLLTLVLAFVVFPTVAFGQLSNDLRWATDLVNNSQPKTSNDRAKIIEQIGNRLGRHSGENRDVLILTRTLEHQLDMLRFEADSLTKSTNKALSAQTRAERLRHLELTRIDLLARASSLMLPLGHSKITVRDAQRITEIVRYASQALDDLRKPSLLGGKTSEYTRLLTRLNGIVKLAQAAEDPEARRILSGLRNTLGTIDIRLKDLGVSVPNPMRSFDIPAEIAGAIIDTSRKGMDETTAALNEVGNAIGGDEQALNRLAEHASRIESTLSPQTYGGAMMKALSDRLIDRIPFVRALVKWNEPQNAASNSVPPPVIKVWPYTLQWSSDAPDVGGELRNYRGSPFRTSYRCPPLGGEYLSSGSDVYGTDVYRINSPICPAAVHAGVITPVTGGVVTVEFLGGRDSDEYFGSERNGLTTRTWNRNFFPNVGGFRFVR